MKQKLLINISIIAVRKHIGYINVKAQDEYFT